MALIAFDGFELVTMSIDTSWYNPGGGSSTNTRFSYGRALSIISSYARRSFPACSRIYFGVAIQIGYDNPSVYLLGDSGATEHIRLSASGNTVSVTRAGTAIPGASSFVVTTGWHYFEISATISDTVGLLQVRVDGASTNIIDVSNVDTRNGGTATTFDAVRFNGTGISGCLYDDFYVCDNTGTSHNTFLGDVRVYTLAPSGAGNYTQFVPSAGANYACVDEQPYSTADYVGSPTTGNRDSYALTDLPASVATVFGTEELAVVLKSDAGAASIKQSLRVALTDYDGAAVALGASPAVLRTLRETNPNTGSAWTAATVNAAEIGVMVG